MLNEQHGLDELCCFQQKTVNIIKKIRGTMNVILLNIKHSSFRDFPN
jgi:hypothetical protein